jgi:hypothetical protein
LPPEILESVSQKKDEKNENEKMNLKKLRWGEMVNEKEKTKKRRLNTLGSSTHDWKDDTETVVWDKLFTHTADCVILLRYRDLCSRKCFGWYRQSSQVCVVATV